MTKKLTKAQRLRALPADIRATVTALEDEILLAVHDLTHQEMERRFGTSSRPLAGALVLTPSPEDRAEDRT